MQPARPELLLALLLLGACQGLPKQDGFEQSLVVAGGAGELGTGGWSEFDDPWLFQTVFALRRENWPVGVELGLQLGGANGTHAGQERDIEMGELWVGAERTWKPSSALILQTGAGLRFAQVSLQKPGFIFADEIDSSASLGAYAHAGAYVHVTGPFALGIDARWADGSDYSLEGVSRDAQLVQVLLGLRWDF